MHPQHVAEFVARELGELRARAAGSGLPIAAIALEGDIGLYVTVDLLRRQRLSTRDAAGAVPVGAGVLLPGGLVLENVPDLSSLPEQAQRVLAFDLTDFDSQPPTAELLSEERRPLPAAEWPADSIGGGIVDGHRDFPRPWFCRPGLREYHSHPQHEDRPWDEIRGDGVSLHGIVLGLVDDLVNRFVL